jgi:hypothetical protein
MTLKCSLWSLLGPEPHIKLRDNRKETAATVTKNAYKLIANYVLVHISWRFNAVQKLRQSPIALSQ